MFWLQAAPRRSMFREIPRFTSRAVLEGAFRWTPMTAGQPTGRLAHWTCRQRGRAIPVEASLLLVGLLPPSVWDATIFFSVQPVNGSRGRRRLEILSVLSTRP